MVFNRTLFDDDQIIDQPQNGKKEAMPLEKLKTLEDKITSAIEKVKTLKEEKAVTDRRIKELEQLLDQKNEEAEQLKGEKISIKSQLESLLNEIETLELA
jgi:FtsZ-binding cell division protein ZapB